MLGNSLIATESYNHNYSFSCLPSQYSKKQEKKKTLKMKTDKIYFTDPNIINIQIMILFSS